MGERRRWIRRAREIPTLVLSVLLLAAIRVSLRIRRLDRTRSWVDRRVKSARPPVPPRGPSPKRLARLVEWAGQCVPGGRQCLAQALTLEALLARRGRDAEVRFGVAHGSDGALDAHAWVVCEGETLLGGEDLDRFTPMAPPRRGDEEVG